MNSDSTAAQRAPALAAATPRVKSELPSELYELAIEVFATEAEALEWLQRPHPILDGSTPLEIALTPTGAQRVKGVLAAIKYGGVV